MGIKNWFEDKKIAWEQKRGRMREWRMNNPKEAVMLDIVAISTVGSIAKVAITTHNKNKIAMRQQKPQVIYDPSMGMYQNLNRPMTPELQKSFNKLVGAGFSRNEALRMLNLI